MVSVWRKATFGACALAVVSMAHPASAQASSAGAPMVWPPSEVMKTKTAEVVVSDVRYRGADRNYPKPVDWGSPPYRAANEVGGRLCNAASDMLRDPSVPTGWQIERILWDAAGVLPTDGEPERQAKVRRWAAASFARWDCDLLGSYATTPLQMMIKPGFDGYRLVDRIIARYGLPLNTVSPRDGRTVLDWTAEQIEQAPKDLSWRDQYTRVYGTLRRLGAKHRKELEAEGAIPLPAALMRQRLAEYATAAQKGDVWAMRQLAEAYSTGGYAPKDLAAAETWLARTEARALEVRNGTILGGLGEMYLDVRGGAQPPYAGKRDRAVRLLIAAQTAQYYGIFAPMDKDNAQYALGRAYYDGLGVAQDRAKALALFRPLTGLPGAQVLAAEMLLQQGRRPEALGHLREVAFSSQHATPFRGTTVAEWLKRQPEGLCGKDSSGQHRC